jgi:hypothetical protein
MVTGFLTSKQGVAGWVYFQTDPIHLGFEPWRQGGAMGSDRLCKIGTSSTSVAIQLTEV